MAKKQIIAEVIIRVLRYKEDGQHIAHALEMDIVGTGSTEQKAIDELKDALCTQIDNCIKEGISPLKRAPEEYFEQWNEFQIRSIMEVFTAKKPVAHKHAADAFSLSPWDRRGSIPAEAFSLVGAC